MAARYEVYRLNRRFRRHQREFHDVMDQCRHDPAAQREIALIWAVRED
jgi:predicted SprT family Zn-dependent metalloprotease